MTEQQQVLFEKLFTKYGSYQKTSCDKRVNIWEEHPETLYTTQDIEKRLKHSTDTIKELENALEMLKAYQCALIERYNYISTAPVKKKIRLERYKKYQGNIFYYIIFYDVNLTDGHQEETNRLTYTGKDRKTAFTEFERLCKENKNAIIEKDIEKKKWER